MERLDYTIRAYDNALMLLNVTGGISEDVGNYFFPARKLPEVLEKLNNPYDFAVSLEPEIFGLKFEINLMENPEELPEGIINETKKRLKFLEERGLKLCIEAEDLDPFWKNNSKA